MVHEKLFDASVAFREVLITVVNFFLEIEIFSDFCSSIEIRSEQFVWKL